MFDKKYFLILVVIELLFLTIPGQSFCSENQQSNRRTPIVEVFEKTNSTVVNISGVRLSSTSDWSGFNWPDIFDYIGPDYQREVSVLGSGVVVQEDGYIITNAHVIKSANNIKAIFSNGDEYSCTVIQSDQEKDLAFLKIQTDKKLPFVHLGRSDDLMIGETVIAIGNPYGYSNTLTTGVISAVDRDIPVSENSWLRGLIQTDAPINPGNSGGPLFNINGDLIGINTAIAAGAENIGFSIPVDTLADNLRQMLMPEKLRRVRLGLSVGRITTIAGQKGLIIDLVTESSPASEVGLKNGDIIIEIDGHKLENILDFYIRMMDKDIGEPIAIRYVRPSAQPQVVREIQLTMQERPLPDGQKLISQFFQMEVSELNEEVAADFGFDNAYPVLIITTVEDDGNAGSIGLRAGDIILGIDGNTIQNINELSQAMEKISENDTVDMSILRITTSFRRQIQRRYNIKLQAKSKQAIGS